MATFSKTTISSADYAGGMNKVLTKKKILIIEVQR